MLALDWMDTVVALACGPVLAYEYWAWHLQGGMFAIVAATTAIIVLLRVLFTYEWVSLPPRAICFLQRTISSFPQLLYKTQKMPWHADRPGEYEWLARSKLDAHAQQHIRLMKPFPTPPSLIPSSNLRFRLLCRTPRAGVPWTW
jgi:hypothetical protein